MAPGWVQFDSFRSFLTLLLILENHAPTWVGAYILQKQSHKKRARAYAQCQWIFITVYVLDRMWVEGPPRRTGTSAWSVGNNSHAPGHLCLERENPDASNAKISFLQTLDMHVAPEAFSQRLWSPKNIFSNRRTINNKTDKKCPCESGARSFG